MKKDWEYGIEKILFTKEEIEKRIVELGKEITNDFKDEEAPLVSCRIVKRINYIYVRFS